LFFPSLEFIKLPYFFNLFLSSLSLVFWTLALSFYSLTLRWQCILIIAADIFKSIVETIVLLFIGNLWWEKLKCFSVIFSKVILILLVIFILHVFVLDLSITKVLLKFITLVIILGHVLLNLWLVKLICTTLTWLLLFMILLPIYTWILWAASRESSTHSLTLYNLSSLFIVTEIIIVYHVFYQFVLL
jgi:hypothetical protein